MIEQRVQDLVREACIKTAIQGRRAISGNNNCMYNTEDGLHCAVGHALSTELQREVGPRQCGIISLITDYGILSCAIKEHLGAKNCPTSQLWSNIQQAHDQCNESVYGLTPPARVGGYTLRRPFGVSWSRWFWIMANSACKAAGFDLGPFPKHLMPPVQ